MRLYPVRGFSCDEWLTNVPICTRVSSATNVQPRASSNRRAPLIMAKTRAPEKSAPVDTADRLLPVNEIAEYLGTHRAWVYRAMRDGTLPYVLVGARRRVRMSDLRAYLDQAS